MYSIFAAMTSHHETGFLGHTTAPKGLLSSIQCEGQTVTGTPNECSLVSPDTKIDSAR